MKLLVDGDIVRARKDWKWTHYSINKERISEIWKPRCSKRNAFLSLATAVEFVNKKYGLDMEINDVKCDFSDMNKQCIKGRCPFYNK